MERKACPLCGRQVDTGFLENRFAVQFWLCPDCGAFAATAEALKVVKQLLVESSEHVNLISYTMAAPADGQIIPLLWKTKSESGPVDVNGLPKTIRNVEDVMTQPVQ